MATVDEDLPLLDRIKQHPRPAAIWLGGVLVLFALQLGAVAGWMLALPWEAVGSVVPTIPGVGLLAGALERVASLPTVLSEELIPNQGYHIPGEGWQETFMGLSPAQAWALRVLLIYTYGFTWFGWLWYGYLIFRRNYRYAKWTPRDDMIDRLRSHRWGQFGLIIVLMFLVMVLFAPAMSPTSVEQNIQDPYTHDITIYDESTGEVTTITAGEANGNSYSRGSPDNNVGPMEYDEYDRFAPFGTLDDGKDLFTFIAYGSRVSLIIGLISIILAGLIATTFGMVTAYYKGAVDLSVVVTGDSIQAMPRLLLLILLSVILSGTWLAGLYNGGVLLALIFAGTGWPGLWRALRGPAFQISEKEWVDAAKSYGQTPSKTMKKHMFPYVLGYLLIYSSLNLGGVIIGIAGLSFLGIGINPPTPEWGRAISAGQPYVATASWHISILPGILIVLVVTAFNALGDGIRDAIDPESYDSTAEAGGTGA